MQWNAHSATVLLYWMHIIEIIVPYVLLLDICIVWSISCQDLKHVFWLAYIAQDQGHW